MAILGSSGVAYIENESKAKEFREELEEKGYSVYMGYAYDISPSNPYVVEYSR